MEPNPKMQQSGFLGGVSVCQYNGISGSISTYFNQAILNFTPNAAMSKSRHSKEYAEKLDSTLGV